MKSQLTYANVVSTVALVLALGAGGAYAANQLAPKSVGEKQLRPGAVTPDKIRKNAVTAPKIKGLAVKSGKIAGGAVESSKIASGAVDSSKIADSSIITSKIASDSVTGEKVEESSLGQVPSAASANSATFAESANPAAFASVSQAGVLDAANSKGISLAKEVEAGIYCLTVSSIVPRGAQVTPQFNGLGTTAAFARIGGAGNPCPTPQVEVQTWSGGSKVGAPFFLVAYR